MVKRNCGKTHTYLDLPCNQWISKILVSKGHRIGLKYFNFIDLIQIKSRRLNIHFFI